MELILVRHGRPARMETTSDPHLNEVGLDQARRAAAWLALEPIEATWSSTMLRAVQTAEAFAGLVGHEVQRHPGIVEFDRNSGVYIPTEELKRENFAAWQAMATGGHGVDMAEFQKMVVDGMEEIIATHPGGKVAVFCHGGVINVWAAHVLGMEPRVFFEADLAHTIKVDAAGRLTVKTKASLFSFFFNLPTCYVFMKLPPPPLLK